MFRTKCISTGIRAATLVIVMMMLLPVNSFAQRRWVERSPRSRIVVYQPRPYVIYQRRPYYTYRTYSYGYQPYYSYNNQPYYSYRYTQPYAANRYAYSWANPTYRYNDGWFYRRHRHNRVRVWLR
jgi:hypothetical protein